MIFKIKKYDFLTYKILQFLVIKFMDLDPHWPTIVESGSALKPTRIHNTPSSTQSIFDNKNLFYFFVRTPREIVKLLKKRGKCGLKSGSRSRNFRVNVYGSFLNLTVGKDYVHSYFVLSGDRKL
jgi:hypothetical protein